MLSGENWFYNQTMKQIGENGMSDMAGSFEDHIRDEYSTFDWIMEGMLEQAGFTIKMAQYNDYFIAEYLCVKR